MARTKLRKFKELAFLSNVIEDPDPKKVQTRLSMYPHRILELGCGKAEYTLALAHFSPKTLVIGVERKGERLWKGAKTALETNQHNTLFLRMDIRHLLHLLPPQSIDEIWITFPDPFPKKGDAKRRLTSEKYLTLYKSFLKKGGILHLKTDDEVFFDYSIESLDQCGYQKNILIQDVHHTTKSPLLSILTTYEKMHLAQQKTIFYLQYTLKSLS